VRNTSRQSLSLGGPVADAEDAIISIHRAYAEAILSGAKTVEFRRKLPAISRYTRLWIYATRPTAAIVGFTTVLDIHRASPTVIWRKHRSKAGLDHAAFSAYFDGSEEAIAILLSVTHRIKPIDVGKLGKVRRSFHPPQVLTRLTASESKILRSLAGRPRKTRAQPS
jgi:predicted transcriptional regulator